MIAIAISFLSGSLGALIFSYVRIRNIRRRAALEFGYRLAFSERRSFADGVAEGRVAERRLLEGQFLRNRVAECSTRRRRMQ